MIKSTMVSNNRLDDCFKLPPKSITMYQLQN
jgi:hypothetical protein